MSADLARIPAGRVALEGMLELPGLGGDLAAQGVVLFAHGSGSGRLSRATIRWLAACARPGSAHC